MLAARCPAAEKLDLRKGDRVCLIGNALAERMQHEGHLEALLHARFPDHDLIFRNLGFSGDEIALRQRSAGFGSPDEWLTRCQADVIFAFFGYNESFAGGAGLPKFKSDLGDWIDSTRRKQYNGKSNPRILLFTPLPHDNVNNPHLPDGQANNERLKLYAAAMAEVAAAKQVVHVDLFSAMRGAFTPGPKRRLGALTINGIHLNGFGDYLVAESIVNSLFGKQPADDPVNQQFMSLRSAVQEKNRVWFHRYRTVDGYSIYGGRADLKFTDGQTNREVMQREMEILDVMTANRDRVVWAAARGQILKPDDSNTPPFIPVVTNKPGPGPNGRHVFLGGEEAIGRMKVASGLKVNLFASEEMFPELAKPVQMAWDARGRLWVAVWPSYPHWRPKDELNDKILILEDNNGDGRADRCTTFADKLHCPTGFALLADGVLVAQAPDVWLLRDTDGDGRADDRERVLHGIDSADTHHAANSFVVGPGGSVFFQEGTFHHTQVETPYGPPVRCVNAGVFRFEPRTWKFDTYVTYGFANPHGHAFDRWGRDIVIDGTNSEPYDAALFSGRIDFPAKHPQPPKVYQPRTRPCPGIEIVSSRHFPDDWQGNLLVGNVIGLHGILRYRLSERGSSFGGSELEPVLSSSDPNFRPSDLKIGADGALYFLDWHNPIIGHMQHNLRDPSRDRTHGRVYRVTCEGLPLQKQPAISGRPVEELLSLLKHPEDRVRERARMELSGRKPGVVIPMLDEWVARLNADDPEVDHHRLEALWVHQHFDHFEPRLLEELLTSSVPLARAATTRVLCDWRDRLPQALTLLRGLAADPNRRVRLEAVRAASYFRVPEAAEVPVIAAQHPTDEGLDYVIGETMRVLGPLVRDAALRNRPVLFATEAGARYLLRQTETARILRRPVNPDDCRELLERPAIDEAVRKASLGALAAAENRDPAILAVEAMARVDSTADRSDSGAVTDLARLLTNIPDRTAARPGLERLATVGKRPVVRQVAFAALVAADGSADRAWQLAASSDDRLADLLAAIPLFSDPATRSALYPRLEKLLTRSPEVVRRAAMTAMTSVRGEEARTFQTLARLSLVGDRDAVAALQRVPVSYWPKDQSGPLLAALLKSLGKLPAAERSSDSARERMQFADALAALVSPEEARRARAALAEMGVRTLRVGTLPERMAFDPEVIAVQAGRPVEFAFHNTDAMPHNFVVCKAGTLETIGLSAELEATDPGFADRHYVPRSEHVLLASRLLLPGQSQRLAFTAPAQPGVYPFVCTYPGHWRRMFGALYVVNDLEAYHAEPKAVAMTVADPLLKDCRPRTDWTFGELRPAVEAITNGRSYVNARHVFGVATCVGCHRFDGQGQEFGPDLAKLDDKWTPTEILRELLDPSHRINDKYQSHRFELASGKVVIGLVVGESADAVKVVENPLASAEPLVLKKADVESRQASNVSLMPKGLLDKLTREEVLDLVAYVAARGDQNHALFRGQPAGHRHGR